MSLSKKLTTLMDKTRNLTGLTGKLSIDNVTSLMSSLKWGQSNLLVGTSDQYKTIKGSGWLSVSTSSDRFIPTSTGTTYTYAATVKNTFGAEVELQLYGCSANKMRNEYLGHSTRLEDGEEANIMVTVTVTNDKDKYLEFGLFSDNSQKKYSSVLIKNERLYIGEAPGIWTPNPADKVGG